MTSRQMFLYPSVWTLRCKQTERYRLNKKHKGQFSHQPSPGGSLNKYQLRLGRQRQACFMVHSVSGWTRCVQVKLWDTLRTRAIPERFRGVFTTRRYANPRLPLPYNRGLFWQSFLKLHNLGSSYAARHCRPLFWWPTVLADIVRRQGRPTPNISQKHRHTQAFCWGVALTGVVLVVYLFEHSKQNTQ